MPLKELSIKAINKELQKLMNYIGFNTASISTQNTTVAAHTTVLNKGGFDLNNIWYGEDCIGTTSMRGYVINGSGTPTGAASSTNSEPGRPGIYRYTTNTATNGQAGIATGTLHLLFGSYDITFEGEYRINQLSTLAEGFNFLIGFGDSTTTPNQTDGAFFLYDERGVATGGSASPNWQCWTANAGTRTQVITSVPVVAGSWIRFKIFSPASGANVQYYINDVLVATITTNIATGATRNFGMVTNLLKSTGTTAVTVDVDWFGHGWRNFTTPRIV